MTKRPLTSLQNPLVKHLVKVRKDRKYREACRSVLIEGRKAVDELLPLVRLKNLLADDLTLLPKASSMENCFLVSSAILEKIAGARSPEGIVAEVALPEESTLEGFKKVVACDGISDPGNLGTIIRTALALGWEGVFLLDNCCDPFNDKALRAAKGATFRLPYRTGSVAELSTLIANNGWQVLAADIEGEDVAHLKPGPAVLLALGSEAHGLSPEMKRISRSLTIPMPGEMESLNVAVAGAILMYLLNQGRPR